MIAIFKKEKDNTLEDGYVKLNISKTYSLLWDIMKLPSIRILAIALLTARVSNKYSQSKFKFLLTSNWFKNIIHCLNI